MEPLLRVWNQARAYWGGLSGLVRGLILGATVLAAVAVGAFAYFNQSGSGVPLFPSGLPEEDVAAVTAVLDSKSIKYTLKDSHTILVPKELVPKARVALAAEGLPARGGGKGFGAFDNSNPMNTQFELTVKYQRALQDELARSIMQLEPVSAARVIIARPESSPFIRFQRPATASVVLKLRPGATLSHGQATSVVMTVARSVDGLTPENVTVVDSTGRMLSQPQSADKDDLPQGLMEHQEKVEHHLAAKAQELLTAHLGVGRAVVTVKADLDARKLKESQTNYPKDGIVPRAERSVNSKMTSAPRGGISGATPNTRPPAGGASGGAGGTSTEEEQQTDYNTSVLVREMEQRMGAITRLTVAVLADLTLPPAGEGQPAAVALTVAQVEQMVRDAVGTSDTRGDRVTVLNTKLAGLPTPTVNEPDEETVQIQRMAAYVELARNISLAVAVVMAVVVIGLLLVRRRPRPGTAAAGAGTSPSAPATPEQRQDLLARFIDTARTDPARTAGAFGLLLGPGGG